MEKKTVLVTDAGGRGSVLVESYARSPHVGRIIAVPGNDLMQLNTDKPVVTYPRLKTTSLPEILQICEEENVSLVDVCQDNAVEAGLVNALMAKGIPVIGPTREAGQIEWDKAWARRFGSSYGLPQPSFQVFSAEQTEPAITFLDHEFDQPWFIKAAYLAEGKGAKPAKNREEAQQRVLEIAKTNAGRHFLIENWLKGDDGSPGEEFSTFIISDGEHYRVLGSAQDHKRVNNFDEGENTGGMGCSSPPLVITPELLREIKKDILNKTINGLKEKDRPYRGILYLGGMLVRRANKPDAVFNDKPYVIEFNARHGDPEAQVILPGLKNDFFEMGMAVSQGDISNLRIHHDGRSRVVVAGASRGYPGDYSGVKGKEITGLKEIRRMDGVRIYGAGIKVIDGRYYASGGRLFYVVGEGADITEARARAYEAMSRVFIEGNNLHYRTDIGWRDQERFYQNR